MLPLGELCRLRNESALNALEPKTRSEYARALWQWIDFITYYCSIGHHLPYNPTKDTLSAFIHHRYWTVSSVSQTLSGLAFTFRSRLAAEWERVCTSQIVTNTIVGGIKLWQRPRKQAKPLSFPSVAFAICTAVSTHLDYDLLLFFAMVALGFASCARSAELVLPSTIRFRNPAKLPRRSTVQMKDSGFLVHLPYHKADRRWQGSYLYFTCNTTNPAFLAILRRYLDARDHRSPTSPLLFVTKGALPPTHTWFISRLCRAFGPGYSGHSLRSGGATHYALRGLPAEVIKRLGWWRSSAWEDYVWVSPQLQQALLSSA